MIHPSPAIIMRADTSISDCVHFMRDHNVGSVLIVSDGPTGALIGIFTERDLVRKIDLIQQGYWIKPVRTVMTTPVHTLDLSQVSQAAQLMLQYNIRHLPITTSDGQVKDRLVGVISMRDIFRQMVVHQENMTGSEIQLPLKTTLSKLKMGVVTEDNAFAKFITKIFSSLFSIPTTQVRKLTEINSINSQSKIDALVLDIDGFQQEIWPNHLKLMSRNPDLKLIIVAFNPLLHSTALAQVLQKLSRTKKFLVFKKPLEISNLLKGLQNF